jgi:hypothetical protein
VQYGVVDESSNGGEALIVVGAQSIVLATRKLQQQKQSNLIEPCSLQRSSKQDDREHIFAYLLIQSRAAALCEHWILEHVLPMLRQAADPVRAIAAHAAADAIRAMNTACVSLLYGTWNALRQPSAMSTTSTAAA